MTDSLAGDAIAETAAALIALEGTAGNERPTMDHVACWLSDRGIDVTQESVPTATLAGNPFYSAEVDRPEVDVLVARVGAGTGGRRLLLNAHVDVVPARHQPGWSHAPFTAQVVDGWLYGRGAADTKGALAAAMHVMSSLSATPMSGAIILTPVVGEEDGGCGTLATLRSGVSADGAVVLEPTDLRVATAVAGALCFRVTIPGRTAHGSVRRTGVSAIEKGWLIHRAILQLEADRAARLSHPLVEGGFPICMGRIEGGDYRCDEAAWLILEGRFGCAPQEPVEQARAELVEAVSRAARADDWLRDNPPTVGWIGAQWVGGHTSINDPLVQAILTAANASPPTPDLGSRRSQGAQSTDLRGGGGAAGGGPTGMSYGCDMGLLRQVADIPTVVYGPGAADVAHAPDERVSIAQLETCARTLRALALDYCR